MIDPDPAPVFITIVKVFEGDDPSPVGSIRVWYRTHPLPEGWRELLEDGTIRH